MKKTAELTVFLETVYKFFIHLNLILKLYQLISDKPVNLTYKCINLHHHIAVNANIISGIVTIEIIVETTTVSAA